MASLQWIESRREMALSWARREHTQRTGLRKRVAGALLAYGELLAQGRSFSQVYVARRVTVVHESGQELVEEREVLWRGVSTCFALAAAVFALGCFASFAGYVAAALGALSFGGVAAAARLLRQPEVATAAWRVATLMAMAMIPIAGNAFAALCLASEVNALRRPLKHTKAFTV